MDDDDECYFEPNGAHQFRVDDLAPLVLNLVEGILAAFHSTAVIAFNLAAGHANFKTQQAQFRQEASLDIERITSESADG